jgi:hypothetical protein
MGWRSAEAEVAAMEVKRKKRRKRSPRGATLILLRPVYAWRSKWDAA